MDIQITFHCQYCFHHQTLVLFTAAFGLIYEPADPEDATDPSNKAFLIDNPYLLRLTCESCSHSSGHLALGYQHPTSDSAKW